MNKTHQPFAHTFSIVARDPVTGQMGVAVQSHWFSVGSVVTWGQAGVGVVATQSLTDISYGPLGLELLRGGKTAHQSLDALLAADDNREVRQVAMIDRNALVATHTGSRCIAEAGHIIGEGFSVQANMMLNSTVPQAMADAYVSASQLKDLDLAGKLLLALEAAQTAGGDIRGMQSAAIKIVSGELTSKSWGGVIMELRVEDHPTPLVELRRLVDVQRAYEYMNKGDDFLAADEPEKAFEAYAAARKLAPHILEIPFWNAVTLAESNRLDEALPIFAEIFKQEPIWLELLKRLPASGLFKADEKTMSKMSKLLD